MTGGTGSFVRLSAEDAPRLAEFAQRAPLVYNDFASIANTMPDETAVWTDQDEHGNIRAAAIDDGLAMTLAGDEDALTSLARAIPDAAGKLVVSGRTPEVRAFLRGIPDADRFDRPEHFMVVNGETIIGAPEAIPLRIATADDVDLLVSARSSALEEEYGVPVPEGSTLHSELANAVARAVAIQGVAVWLERGRIAFTAQLIAKTPQAATFGDLYTDPALRGAGRATRGLVAFCHWLMSECTNVTLRVGTGNTPAVRLYERVGFEVLEPFLSSVDSASRPGTS
jgi:predicted GNAT family acetyltransferase